MASDSDPQSYLKRHLINLVDRHRARASSPRASTTGCCAPTRRSSTACRCSGCSSCPSCPAWAPRSHGAHAWIVLPGGFTVQPSEFAKVASSSMMAMLLSEKRDAENEPRDRDVLLRPGGGRVPDPHHARAARPRHRDRHRRRRAVGSSPSPARARAGWSASSAAAVVGVMLAIQLGLLKEYQVHRLTAFTNPTADSRGAATTPSRRASRSAAAAGSATGLFQGPQTQGKFVPDNETDFIFTVAGEELGFVGARGHHRAARRRAVAGGAHRLPGRRPVRPPRRDRHRRAGSPSRCSRTSG